MRYLSLDLETTGLDPQKDQILMVGAVVEDTEYPEIPVEELPTFGCYVRHDRYEGNAFAIGMNGWIFDIISGRAENEDLYPIYNGYKDKEYYFGSELKYWVNYFKAFLNDNFPAIDNKWLKIVLTGKNVAKFDYHFLPPKLQDVFHHRMIDPGSCFIDWSKDYLPSLENLKKKLDIGNSVTHNAVEDARDVVRVLRAGTNNYSF